MGRTTAVNKVGEPTVTMGIKDEIKVLDNELQRYKARVKERNEKERKAAELKLEQKRMGSNLEKKVNKYELNLDPDYWRPRFIFPYSLDPTPLSLPDKLNDQIDFDIKNATTKGPNN